MRPGVCGPPQSPLYDPALPANSVRSLDRSVSAARCFHERICWACTLKVKVCHLLPARISDEFGIETRNSKKEEQLFDLISDPEEMIDLKSVASKTKSEMIEQMMDALIESDDAARGAPTTLS